MKAKLAASLNQADKYSLVGLFCFAIKGGRLFCAALLSLSFLFASTAYAQSYDKQPEAHNLLQAFREKIASRYLNGTINPEDEIKERVRSNADSLYGDEKVIDYLLGKVSYDSLVPEGEDLILSPQTAFLQLNEIFGTKSGPGVIVPLSLFAEVFALQLDIDFDNASVDGWFFFETNTVHFKKPENDTDPVIVKLKEDVLVVDQRLISFEADDVYIHTFVLEHILGIKMDLSLRDLTLQLDTDGKLPAERRIRREERTNRVSYGGIPEIEFEAKDNSHGIISLPLLDVSLNNSLRKNASTGLLRTSRLSVLGVNDLAFMSAQYNFSGSLEGGTRFGELTLSRYSEDGKALGNLGLTRFSVGGVSPVSLQNLNTGGQERGIRVSNLAGNQTTNLDATEIRGTSHPGWEVELYRNGTWIERLTVGDDGEYVFTDVSLFAGENIFTLRLYGPFGEEREETKSITVDRDTVASKGLNFDLSVTQQGRRLFQSSPSSEDLERGFSTDNARINFSTRANVNQDLSLVGGLVTHTSETDGSRIYQGQLGGTFFANDDVFNFNLVGDFSSGALRSNVSVQSRLLNQSVNLNLRRDFGDFSDVRVVGSKLVSSLGLGLAGNLFKARGIGVSYGTDLSVTNFSDNRRQYNGSLSLTGFYRSYLISNRLNYNLNTGGLFGGNERADGNLNVTKTVNKGTFRGRLSYRVLPVRELLSFDLNYSKSLETGERLTSGLRYLIRSKDLQAQASYSQDLPFARLSSTLTLDTNGAVSAAMNLRFGVGISEFGTPQFVPGTITGSTNIIARVFHDVNYNGKFDSEDEVVKDAIIEAVHLREQSRTGGDGIAVVPNISVGRTTDIRLDPSSLPDPFWVPVKKGFSITGRRGSLKTYDFPVVSAGEVEGEARFKEKGMVDFTELDFAPLTLKGVDNDNVYTVITEFDGFYYIPQVIPGTYELSIDPDFLEENGWAQVDKVIVTLSKGEDILSAVDIKAIDKELLPTEPKEALQAGVLQVARLGSFNTRLAPGLLWASLKYRLKGKFGDLQLLDASKVISVKPVEVEDSIDTQSGAETQNIMYVTNFSNQSAMNEFCLAVKNVFSDCSISLAKLN